MARRAGRCPSPSALAEAAALLRGRRAPADRRRRRRRSTARRRTRCAPSPSATGIPVAETQAGKGALPYDHPQSVGAIGATGTTAANALAARADVVLGIGTRWSDFTTASRSVFAADGVRFINLNVARSTRTSRRACRWSRDALRGHRGPRRRARGLGRAGRAHRARDARSRPDVGPEGRGGLHARPRAAAGPERGHRHRQPRERAARRRGLRRGQHAGRPAQAVADARPEGLPRRIRLLVHGLRDRGRARRSGWPTPAATCS